MSTKRIVVIGGVAAGMSAASAMALAFEEEGIQNAFRVHALQAARLLPLRRRSPKATSIRLAFQRTSR